MGNVLDYLAWRGDLSFAVSPFNEVDNVILSAVSYVDFTDCVPGIGEGSVTLKEASEKFFSLHDEKELRESRSFIRFAPFLLHAMMDTDRFSQMKLQNFYDVVDHEKELQFSAVELLTSDGISYVSFRGTDDTIVGWKEDFNLSYRIVPAELEAIRYLNRIHAGRSEKIRAGGHSKGGHMAVFAAAQCDEAIRQRIIAIYNIDGPGCNETFIDDPALEKISHLIHRYVPDTSIIGTLMDHISKPIILKSSAKGVMQHRPTTWDVLGTSFVRQPDFSTTGKVLQTALHDWIYQVNIKDRRQVVDDLFSVLEASGFDTVSELQENGLKAALPMLDRLDELDPKTQESTRLLFRTLADALEEADPLAQLREKLKTRLQAAKELRHEKKEAAEKQRQEQKEAEEKQRSEQKEAAEKQTQEQKEAVEKLRQEQRDAAVEKLQEQAEAAVEKLQAHAEAAVEKLSDTLEAMKEQYVAMKEQREAQAAETHPDSADKA